VDATAYITPGKTTTTPVSQSCFIPLLSPLRSLFTRCDPLNRYRAVREGKAH